MMSKIKHIQCRSHICSIIQTTRMDYLQRAQFCQQSFHLFELCQSEFACERKQKRKSNLRCKENCKIQQIKVILLRISAHTKQRRQIKSHSGSIAINNNNIQFVTDFLGKNASISNGIGLCTMYIMLIEISS